MTDLADGRAIAGEQHLPAAMETGEHSLLAIGKDVVRAEHHGERDDAGGEAVLPVLSQQDVFAEQLVEAVLVLSLAAIYRKALVDGEELRRRVVFMVFGWFGGAVLFELLREDNTRLALMALCRR